MMARAFVNCFALLSVLLFSIVKADIAKIFNDKSTPVLKPISNGSNDEVPTFVISGIKENKDLKPIGKVQLINLPQFYPRPQQQQQQPQIQPQQHFGLPYVNPFRGGFPGMGAQFGGMGLASNLQGFSLNGLGRSRQPGQIITEFELDANEAEELLAKFKHLQ